MFPLTATGRSAPPFGPERQKSARAMANETQKKFGYPGTLIRDYRHWCVLLRPAQVTLGSLVLVCKDEARQFSELSPQAFAELGDAVIGIEQALKAFRPWDKINYLMLMMVDPDVHFHVIPRYSEPQDHHGRTFPDTGWPGPPNLADAVTPSTDECTALIDDLKSVWPEQD